MGAGGMCVCDVCVCSVRVGVCLRVYVVVFEWVRGFVHACVHVYVYRYMHVSFRSHCCLFGRTPSNKRLVIPVT